MRCKLKRFKFIPKRCEFCKYYNVTTQFIYNTEVKNVSCLNPRFGHYDAKPNEYCSSFTPML